MSNFSGYKQGASSEDKPPVGIKLDKEDYDALIRLHEREEAGLRELAELQLRIQTVAHGTQEARQRREAFCLEIEEKYKIAKGVKWSLNADDKSLVVKKTDPIVR